MAVLVLNDDEKIGVEELLLGDKTITRKDCNGDDYQLHGLTANDLIIKSISNAPMPLKEYIDVVADREVSVETADIITDNGTHTTIKEIANSIESVQFEILDLQAKYDTLKG
jgi:hypothetical protein